MNLPNAVPSSESESIQLDLLLKGCTHSINQCDYLLQNISEDSYASNRHGGSSIGAHMRHILDRFQCFFYGIQDGFVDYDARKRDRSIESSLEVAQFAVAGVEQRIEDLRSSGSDSQRLQVQESVHHLCPKVALESTISRELMGLITHTTHHLAIIGLMAREMGYELDRNFGKAPSTIVYESS